MRIGGPFPLNPAGSFPVSLGPGQYFYPPPGNYLTSLGGQTVMQWWDPINSNWRNLGLPGSQMVPIQTDGYNFRLINLSGVVIGASITNVGSGGVNGIGPTQTGSTLAVAAPGGNAQTAKGYVIVGGSLPALNVAQGGSAFVVPPLILIDPPPAGGIQATAVSTITTAGVLTSATLVNPGAGYTALPNVYVVPQFLDYPGQPALPYTIPTPPTPIAPNFPPGQIAIGPGSGNAGTIPQNFMQGLQGSFPASAGALVNFGAGVLGGSGTLTGVVMTDYGSAYNTSVPAITFGGTSIGAVAATAVMSWAVQSITAGTGGTMAIGAPVETTLGQLLAAPPFFDNDYVSARPMRGHTTSAAGAVTIDDNGFGMQIVLTNANVGFIFAPTSTVAPTGGATPTMGGINDTSLLQAFVNE